MFVLSNMISPGFTDFSIILRIFDTLQSCRISYWLAVTMGCVRPGGGQEPAAGANW